MTNLEVYKKALNILNDIQGFDIDCGHQTKEPATIATIIYQLLEEKEKKNNGI